MSQKQLHSDLQIQLDDFNDDNKLQEIMNKLKNALLKKLKDYQQDHVLVKQSTLTKNGGATQNATPRTNKNTPLSRKSSFSPNRVSSKSPVRKSKFSKQTPLNKKQNDTKINSDSETFTSQYKVQTNELQKLNQSQHKFLQIQQQQLLVQQTSPLKPSLQPYSLQDLEQNYQLNAKKFKDSGFDLQKFLHEEIDREFERINPWKNLTQFVIKNSKVNPSQKESQIKNEQIQGKSMGDKMEEYIKKINDMKNQIKFDILRKQQMKGKNRSNSKKVKRISGSIKVAAPSLTPQQQDKVNGLLIDKQQENSQAANSDQLIQEFKIRRSINNRMNPNPPKAQSKINLLNLDLQKTENPQVQENQPKPSLFLKLHKDEAKSLLQNMSGLICYQSEGFQLGKSTDSKAKLNLANQYEITDPKSVQCLKKNEERLLALKKGLREIENRYQSNQLILEQAQQTYSRFQFRRFSEPYQEKQGDQDAYIFRPRTSEINYYQQLNNNQSNPKNERIERSSRAHHNSVILNTSLYDKYSNHHQSSSTHKLCKIDSQLNPSSNPSQSNKIFNHKPQLNHLKNQSVQNFSTPQQTTKKNHSSNQNLLRRSHELKHVTNLNKILNRLCQPDYYPNLDYIQHKNANFTSRKPKVIRFSNIGEKDNDITSQRGKRIHGSQVLLGKLDIHQIKLRSWKEQIRLQNVEMVV